MIVDTTIVCIDLREVSQDYRTVEESVALAVEVVEETLTRTVKNCSAEG